MEGPQGWTPDSDRFWPRPLLAWTSFWPGAQTCLDCGAEGWGAKPQKKRRPKGGCPEAWVPRRVGWKGAPLRVGARVGGIKFRAFFPLPLQISLFFAVSGVFSWNCGPCSRSWTSRICALFGWNLGLKRKRKSHWAKSGLGQKRSLSGVHLVNPTLQVICASSGPAALGCATIPRQDPQERENKNKHGAGE